MIEAIHELLKLGGKSLKNFLLCIYRVVLLPKSFFKSIREDSEDQFVQGSIFACFISILNLVIVLPVQRVLHVGVESTSYVIVDTIFTYAMWFLGGSIYHGIARVVRGHGKYRGSVTTFLYLTAFQPITAFVGLPVLVLSQRELMKGAASPFEVISRIAVDLPNKPAVIISSILGFFSIIYFFVVSVIAYREIHQVGYFRAFLIASLGFLGFQLAVWALEPPTLRLIWEAFPATPK
jgi:hypothetical protein